MRTRNYWIYFFASLVSLVGSNYFIFTQGWYLLQLTGQKASVGVTWTLFFLPSLLFLPLIGKMLDSARLKQVILGFEAAKLAIFAGFVPLLAHHPSRGLVYLMATLYGIAFAPYHPSVYVIVKRLVPAERQTRYSHLFEVSLQLANVAAAFTSGFIFDAFGFVRLIALSAALILLGLLGMARMRLDGADGNALRFDAAAVSSAYRDLAGIVVKLLARLRRGGGESGLDGIPFRDLVFGMIHPLPQAAIMVSNVPLILYVHELMHRGAREFGILDAAFGAAALAASLFWARWHALSHRASTRVGTGILAASALVGMGLVPSSGAWPYAWTVVYGGLLVSSKILARATVVRIIPRERMGVYSTAFQAMGYAAMLALFGVVSALSSVVGPRALFGVLGLLIAGYSGAALALSSAEAAAGAQLWGRASPGWDFRSARALSGAFGAK